MDEARLAVLLCTYNGAGHLEEQLDSIAQQELRYVDIWVSDDGSTDETLALLERYKDRWHKGRFVIRPGPRKGFAANFLSLVCDAEIEADYYAYCDQDDIWEKYKLSRAVKALSIYEQDKATLYCSRTELITETGELMRINSPLFSKKPGFRNALVQSLAGGNTMVFNHQTKKLLSEAGELKIVSHDWWTYMLVTGADGIVVYDNLSSILYRQHENNEMGANTSWAARLNRLSMLLVGTFREWNNINISALKQVSYLLTEENKRVLELFCVQRDAGLFKRLKLASELRLYRQTLFGNIALIGATLLKKL
jgi:glycosyltransferase involved in cell wall biosynthesis